MAAVRAFMQLALVLLHNAQAVYFATSYPQQDAYYLTEDGSPEKEYQQWFFPCKISLHDKDNWQHFHLCLKI